MHVVTLTSDWSKEDFYISSLTGAILSLSNDIQFVQVNNSIKQFNVIEGFFILKHSFFHFPKVTIHLFGVNSEPLDGQNIIIMNYKEHWFVSIDDGRLSLIVDSDTNINAIYKLPDKLKIGTFSALGYFKEAVKLIINNSVDKLEKLNGIKYAANNMPTINGLNLQGNIIHIDSYGNAISNISKKFFIEYYLKLSGELNRNPDFKM